MPLSDDEYEDAYAEALRCLFDTGHAVGKPSHDGTARYCMVNGHRLTDKDVLELWWEPEIARKILQGRQGCAGPARIA